MSKINIPNKRLYKWIGGKNWLSTKLKIISNQNLKTDRTIYIEPFIGGLGSFLAILPILIEKQITTFVLNDINEIIINLLKEIRDNPDNIIKNYIKLQKEFYLMYPDEVCELNTTKDKVLIKTLLYNASIFFKEKKTRFNFLKLKDKLNNDEKSEMNTLFLFLMKHSFNGVYRENSKGEFNTPFNWNNKKENIAEKIEIIKSYHLLFNSINIIFENLDVITLLNKYKENKIKSFLYLDPPYANENTNENKYNKNVFDIHKQIELLDSLKDFDNYIYSNHSLNIFKEYFSQDTNHSYEEVNRKNIMTSKSENRQNDILEIIGIKN